MFDVAFELIAEIVKMEENATAYIVGGAVRDYVLGRECDDIDIATSVDINKIDEAFETHDIGKNKDFGIVVVKFKGHLFEVANYRSDGEYTDNRRPDSVEIVSDFKTDSLRRDFTINAMAMDADKNVIDYHGGQEDLKKGIIRTVGCPFDRFEEDALRMLRAIRFASVLDFEIHPDTQRAITSLEEKIRFVSFERIWKEFWKMACGDNFSKGVILMKETKILRHILPEMYVMDQYPHYRKHHPEGNVWEHVVGVMRQLDNKSAVIKLGGMFHDIGKPSAYKWYEEKQKYHYLKHDFIGLDVFKDIVLRLHIPKVIAEEIRYCIKNHMRMHDFNKMKDAKCYRMMDSPYWESLYEVAYADDRSRLYLFEREFWNKLDAKVERLKGLLETKQSMEEVLNGHLVMDLLDLKGGKVVGDVLKKAKDYVINHKIDVKSEDGYSKLEKYIKQFK